MLILLTHSGTGLRYWNADVPRILCFRVRRPCSVSLNTTASIVLLHSVWRSRRPLTLQHRNFLSFPCTYKHCSNYCSVCYWLKETGNTVMLTCQRASEHNQLSRREMYGPRCAGDALIQVHAHFFCIVFLEDRVCNRVRKCILQGLCFSQQHTALIFSGIVSVEDIIFTLVFSLYLPLRTSVLMFQSSLHRQSVLPIRIISSQMSTFHFLDSTENCQKIWQQI